MEFPSSPPLLPEPEPPTSPTSELPFRPDDVLVAAGSRKRAFSDCGSVSSDPLFSEGTSETGWGEEEEECGERRRRKKLVKGPYFTARRTSTRSLRQAMARREHIRNADSGVWLGSDVSDDSIDSATPSQQRVTSLHLHDLPSRARQSTAPTQPTCSPAEAHARSTITECLDTGRETIDLTDLRLTELSNASLKPLHQLIRHSHTDLTHPPSEDEFTPLTPSIKLFLYGNKLSTLPSELFRLHNITVLSLRNNELLHIPPTIGQLAKLEELNIAQNKIRWLPWELFDRFDCAGTHRKVNVRPNPLFSPLDHFQGSSPLPRPNATPGELREHLSRWGETNGAFFSQMRQWYGQEGVPWSMRHELELRLKLGRIKLMNYLEGASRAGTELQMCKEQLIYLASSAVKYFAVDGTLRRPSRSTCTAKEDDDEQFRAVFDPFADAPESSERLETTSLFELALRSVQANFSLRDLHDVSDGIPPSIAAALARAATGAEDGNQSCAVCHKQFIIARAEWIEFWFNGFPSQVSLTQESVLPFLRRVCSWECARPSELGAFR
ncbi:hypothetical protein LTR37_007196 [Vermiconidia calcicola]|uniref:Uncharacterized protein n=1 Tax=Vermiconidia calcicola TaxID=1690605 RepID=A0ACC3NGT6_9PEZI|nr:hypothetical protein LTR37_007196 [Vermiconidia calcicola]